MKKTLITALALAVLSGSVLADRLDDIKSAGALRAAVFDSNPPFGFVDAKTKKISGLDVEYAEAIAKKIGVKLELVPTNPANRIPLLVSGKADIVAANFTITDERAKQIDFSQAYFATGARFIARKGALKTAEQLDGLRVGVDRGTTQEILLRDKYPKVTLVAYDDTPLAFAALRNGNVQAISQDDAKLIALLAQAPDKEKYEVSPFALSREFEGVGIPKGEARLVSLVNETLVSLEKSGQTQRIYDRWFGPKTKAPLARDFKIGDKAE